ncbi:8163_t:CDS:1, partial [Entrophospora sp. SA101]
IIHKNTITTGGNRFSRGGRSRGNKRFHRGGGRKRRGNNSR